MEIRDLLKADLMIFNLSANDKKSAIEEIADKFYEKGYVKSREDFKNGLIKREEEGSTALGESVAIPHTKNETVKEPAVLFARKVGGLDYQALDGEPTEIFFCHRSTSWSKQPPCRNPSRAFQDAHERWLYK